MGAKKKQDDEIRLDFSKVKTRFKNVDAERWLMICLLIAAMVLVFYVRMLPASLPVTDDWAEQSVRQNIQSQVAQQVNAQYPSLPQTNKDRLIQQRTDEFLEQNKAQLEAAESSLSEQLKQSMRYEGADGRQYTYLGDLDSYFWIRYTRNWLETGTVCDAIEDGVCRDLYITAPNGGETGFNPSSHVFAIGYLHKFLTIFNPDRPLPATSFLVPVLAGLLGVIPAFFIGRRLGGNVAGLFAAIIISLHPLVLSRSMGSDNDIWNIVLPLFILWMTIEALEADSWKGKTIFASISGLLIAIFATFWIGWWFIYLIILFGLLAYAGFVTLRYVIQNQDFRFWKDKTVRLAAIVLVSFYIAALIFLVLFGQKTIVSYVEQPLSVFSQGAKLDEAVKETYWPNVLTTVAELSQASLGTAINQMGGKILFFASLLGLMLMTLPRQAWKWRHYAVLGLGALISLYLINNPAGNKFMVLFLIGLPLAITFGFYLFWKETSTTADALIILVWFLAAIYATYSGVRFILLLVPAYGIAFAVLAGRIYQWLTSYLHREFDWNKHLLNAAVFLAVILLLIQPVSAGYQTARNFIPTMNDGWWDSLTQIREQSDENAIISSWWDFGHWFKYVADRRVSADGTSQHTHIPRWLGLSLITNDEDTSVGVLRMLDCGGDTYPSEYDTGAYGKILTVTDDPLQAQQIVTDLVQLNEEDAHQYLLDRGFTDAQAGNVLESTHCNPPEGYFITSEDMVGKAGVWAHFGLWDFDRAYIAKNAHEMPQEEAVQDFVERFNYTQEQARSLYFDALSQRTESEVNAWVSPWPGYVTGNWRSCQEQFNGTLIACPLQIGIAQNNGVQSAIDAFLFNKTSMNTTMVFAAYQNGQRIQQNIGQPAKVVIADEDGISARTFDSPASPNIAVLLDTVENRVLLADPHIVDSIFTQLFYLEGRYNEHFEMFSDRTTFSGTRIIVWKVIWDE